MPGNKIIQDHVLSFFQVHSALLTIRDCHRIMSRRFPNVAASMQDIQSILDEAVARGELVAHKGLFYAVEKGAILKKEGVILKDAVGETNNLREVEPYDADVKSNHECECFGSITDNELTVLRSQENKENKKEGGDASKEAKKGNGLKNSGDLHGVQYRGTGAMPGNKIIQDHVLSFFQVHSALLTIRDCHRIMSRRFPNVAPSMQDIQSILDEAVARGELVAHKGLFYAVEKGAILKKEEVILKDAVSETNNLREEEPSDADVDSNTDHKLTVSCSQEKKKEGGVGSKQTKKGNSLENSDDSHGVQDRGTGAMPGNAIIPDNLLALFHLYSSPLTTSKCHFFLTRRFPNIVASMQDIQPILDEAVARGELVGHKGFFYAVEKGTNLKKEEVILKDAVGETNNLREEQPSDADVESNTDHKLTVSCSQEKKKEGGDGSKQTKKGNSLENSDDLHGVQDRGTGAMPGNAIIQDNILSLFHLYSSPLTTSKCHFFLTRRFPNIVASMQDLQSILDEAVARGELVGHKGFFYALEKGAILKKEEVILKDAVADADVPSNLELELFGSITDHEFIALHSQEKKKAAGDGLKQAKKGKASAPKNSRDLHGVQNRRPIVRWRY